MKKVQYITMGSYPIYVGFTDCPKAFAAELKRLDVKDCPAFVPEKAAGCVHFLESESNLTTVIMCIDRAKAKGKTLSQQVSLIAHEATHIWQDCKRVMNEKNPGDEIEAYAIQWITQCCVDLFLEKPKKIAKP